MNCVILWGALAITLLFLALALFVYFVLPKIGQGLKNLVRESLEEAVSSPQLRNDLSELTKKVVKDAVDEIITLPELREAGKAIVEYIKEVFLSLFQ